MSLVSDFIIRVQAVHKTGIAREHAYRPALHDLLKALDNNLTPVNDPAKSDVGAPDFIILRDTIAIGHLEAKDIDIDIRAMKDANKRQMDRYVGGLANLIYTNCLDWDFYRDGQRIASVRIGDYLMGIQPIPDNFAQLENLLRDFVAQRPQSITRPEDLAARMAGKAVLIKDVLFNALRTDPDLRSELGGQYQAFREHLIHDIGPEDFADIYAETIAYGMFAARLHDDTPDTFSRQEALNLLPKSNPFLRSLFGYIAGIDLDDRIAWIIDDLASVFRASNVRQIMAGFGKLTAQKHPFLHFYETFLAAYNPAKRKARGVWYTPEPVVNFIVRAVDEVLQTEFGLPDGLADTSKVTVDWDTGHTDARGKPLTIRKEVHRVQILDPATGTGTFLAEVIKQIAPKVKDVAEGMWSPYIEKDLIPRLHGFELLMASYAMCHMKLDMILTELGYKPTGTPPRLGVYLTNSLEEGEREVRDLFMAQWLTREAREANTIKRQTPIMCVIGNPPYSGHSSNKGEWINSLMAVYKKSPELKLPAQAKWLSDDYVKFIRFSESLIEKNGEGVLGFITNHGYLDNPTFKDMRLHLMETFDRIHVIDLHGNAKKKEVSPDGSADKNVFDIQQGVAIIVAVKKRPTGSKSLASVYHHELWGTREKKYGWLLENGIHHDEVKNVTPTSAPWLFEPRNNDLFSIYDNYFGLPDFFSPNGRPAPGVVTTQDQFAISWDAQEASEKVETFLKADTEEKARSLYRLCSTTQWNYAAARRELVNGEWRKQIIPISYRPLDTRFTVYNPHVAVHRRERVSAHFLGHANFGLATARSNKNPTPDHFFVTDKVMETKFAESSTQSTVFPLYLYPTEQDLDQSRRINFDPKLYARLKTLTAHPTHGTPDEVAVFDYIYGVLHCPAYRTTYAEFLKIDFPRIPWPATPDEFWDVSTKGTQLRKLHLMDPATIGPTPYPFKGEGAGMVDKPRFEGGKVWINATQYFDNAPDVSWTFYIGGYQPAQKWLKDRKGRALTFEDVKHYQRILKILSETDRIMQTIQMDLSTKS